MKRRLYGITFLMVLGLSILNLSCSKEEVNSFVVPTGSILVSEPGEVGSTHFNSHNIASIVTTTVPDGWSVNDIDLYSGTITVTAPKSFNDDEVTEGDLKLTGYTPTGDSRAVTIYVAILPNADIDFSSKPANCFIVTQPKTRYHFNPYVGGSNVTLDTEKVVLLWESRKELINYTIIADKCKKCSLCSRQCPVEAISGTPGKTVFVIDQDKCIKCGMCLASCKFDAIIKE